MSRMIDHYITRIDHYVRQRDEKQAAKLLLQAALYSGVSDEQFIEIRSAAVIANNESLACENAVMEDAEADV